MVVTLRDFAIFVLVSMLVVTGWASSVQALWKIPGEVGGNPWFVATLLDAYFGFLGIWFWVVLQGAFCLTPLLRRAAARLGQD